MYHRLILVLVITLSGLLGGGQVVGGQGSQQGLLPDLVALPPSNLRFDRLPDGTHILRFSNTVWNTGPGRLELQGSPHQTKNEAKQITQNFYDQAVGGNLVSSRVASEDVLYHEGHQHFHFTDFADYFLLVHDGSTYVFEGKKGIKTSFCIMDTTRVSGRNRAQYTSCGMELQGMSVGWGDTYGYYLDDQWVVLGDRRLPAGTYQVKSIVNPAGKILEGNATNNEGLTCFTVNNRDKIRVISC
jgi:hypothetical protein